MIISQKLSMKNLGHNRKSSFLQLSSIVQLSLLVLFLSSCVVSRRMNTSVITPKNSLQFAGSFEFSSLDENIFFGLIDREQQLLMYPILQARVGLHENMDVGFQAVYFNSISADVSYQLTRGANPSTLTLGFGLIPRNCSGCEEGGEYRVPSIYTEYSIGYKSFYLNPKLTYELGVSFNNRQVKRLGYAFAGGSVIPGLGIGFSPRKNKIINPVVEVSAFKFKTGYAGGKPG